MSLVKDVLTTKGTDVATVGRDSKVIAAVRIMRERRIGSVVVVDGDKILGIFTERDLMNRVVADSKDPAKTIVGEVMTDKVAICTKDCTLEWCRSAMTRHKLRHLPVIENGKLAGIISSGDILARELMDQEATIRYLNEYMAGPH